MNEGYRASFHLDLLYDIRFVRFVKFAFELFNQIVRTRFDEKLIAKVFMLKVITEFINKYKSEALKQISLRVYYTSLRLLNTLPTKPALMLNYINILYKFQQNRSTVKKSKEKKL